MKPASMVSLSMAVIGCAVFSSSVKAQAPSFQPLGDLPGGSFSSSAWCVSADGSRVAGGSSSASGSQAFQWEAISGMVGLGDLPEDPFGSHIRAMSGNGGVLVGYGDYTANTSQAVRWIGGVPIGLGIPGDMTRSFGNGVSADGDRIVVDGSAADLTSTIFLWSAMTGLVQIPPLSDGKTVSAYMYANGISADGSTVVGSSYINDTYQSFRWTQSGGTQLLPDLSGGLNFSGAGAASADGSVIVGIGYDAVGRQATRWTQATGMESLGMISGASNGGDALAVSADGSVIVGMVTLSGPGPNLQRAWIWDAHYGMRDLRSVLVGMGVQIPTAWKLGAARAITPDCRTIVGYGYNSVSQVEAFRVQLNRPGDVTYDGQVDIDDLVEVITHWGECPPLPTVCTPDAAPYPFGNGVVNIDDLVAVITAWTN